MAATHARKTDRRVLRTRKAIMNAFDKLISGKSDDKVTVSAIAREAGIDRKTFYLHFKSVDDLANRKAEAMLEQILAALKAEGAGKSFPERMHIILAEVNGILTANVSVYSSIAAHLSTDQVLEHLQQAAEPALLHSGLGSEVVADQQSRMRMQFFIAGAISLYATWLKSERNQPIETVSGAIEEAILSLYTREQDPTEPSREAPVPRDETAPGRA